MRCRRFNSVFFFARTDFIFCFLRARQTIQVLTESTLSLESSFATSTAILHTPVRIKRHALRWAMSESVAGCPPVELENVQVHFFLVFTDGSREDMMFLCRLSDRKPLCSDELIFCILELATGLMTTNLKFS